MIDILPDDVIRQVIKSLSLDDASTLRECCSSLRVTIPIQRMVIDTDKPLAFTSSFPPTPRSLFLRVGLNRNLHRLNHISVGHSLATVEMLRIEVVVIYDNMDLLIRQTHYKLAASLISALEVITSKCTNVTSVELVSSSRFTRLILPLMARCFPRLRRACMPNLVLNSDSAMYFSELPDLREMEIEQYWSGSASHAILSSLTVLRSRFGLDRDMSSPTLLDIRCGGELSSDTFPIRVRFPALRRLHVDKLVVRSESMDRCLEEINTFSSFSVRHSIRTEGCELDDICSFFERIDPRHFIAVKSSQRHKSERHKSKSHKSEPSVAFLELNIDRFRQNSNDRTTTIRANHKSWARLAHALPHLRKLEMGKLDLDLAPSLYLSLSPPTRAHVVDGNEGIDGNGGIADTGIRCATDVIRMFPELERFSGFVEVLGARDCMHNISSHRSMITSAKVTPAANMLTIVAGGCCVCGCLCIIPLIIPVCIVGIPLLKVFTSVWSSASNI